MYLSFQGRACCGGRCRGEIFRTLHSAVEAFGLQDCWKAKPLLTGKEVILPYMLAELSWLESGLSVGAHHHDVRNFCMTHLACVTCIYSNPPMTLDVYVMDISER